MIFAAVCGLIKKCKLDDLSYVAECNETNGTNKKCAMEEVLNSKVDFYVYKRNGCLDISSGVGGPALFFRQISTTASSSNVLETFAQYFGREFLCTAQANKFRIHQITENANHFLQQLPLFKRLLHGDDNIVHCAHDPSNDCIFPDKHRFCLGSFKNPTTVIGKRSSWPPKPPFQS